MLWPSVGYTCSCLATKTSEKAERSCLYRLSKRNLPHMALNCYPKTIWFCLPSWLGATMTMESLNVDQTSPWLPQRQDMGRT